MMSILRIEARSKGYSSVSRSQRKVTRIGRTCPVNLGWPTRSIGSETRSPSWVRVDSKSLESDFAGGLSNQWELRRRKGRE